MDHLTTSDSAQIKHVLQNFVDASARHDVAAIRACLNRATLEAGFPETSVDGMDFTIGEPRLEQGRVVVPIKGYPTGAPAGTPPAMEIPCLMELEDGQWKFDLAATGERMSAGIMDQMTTAMSEMMGGLGEMVSEGLGKVFGESEPETWDDTAPTPGPDELFPLPELTTLPKTQAALTEAAGALVLMEAELANLLQRAGSDESDVLFNWFEDQLFAGWAPLLAEIARQIPLKDRLRAVRIESVAECHNRLLALDGSDLVYRMMLPYNEGFFQDDEVAAMLPGVLAGLPEMIDPAVAGYRLLPGEDEDPAVEDYRRKTAPRLIRRISALAGRHVALEVDWHELRDVPRAGGALGLWGLNRVLGGFALARLAQPVDLQCIRIHLNSEVTCRFARFENGTLDVGINFFGGDHPGPYEHEIAQAFPAILSNEYEKACVCPPYNDRKGFWHCDVMGWSMRRPVANNRERD